jgi:hypothetical protein
VRVNQAPRRVGGTGSARVSKSVGASCVAALCALWLAACSDREVSDDRALRELERTGFVPVGRMRLESLPAPFDDVAISRPLLADLYEFTWGDWRALASSEPALAPTGELRTTYERAEETWPAQMSQASARGLATVRGMRLPTPTEWMYIASGTSGLRYPWGPRDQLSVANTLELGLLRPAAVGTFESGRGPFGHYDLVGNVWEWVDGSVRGLDPAEDDHAEPDPSRGLCSAMGGSYRQRHRELYVAPRRDEPARVLALLLDQTQVAADIGMRCVVDAETYLCAHAEQWERAGEGEARVTAVGRRFGATAEPFLRTLAEAPEAPRALRWLHAGSLRP